MATEYVIMPKTDYVAICDEVRKTSPTATKKLNARPSDCIDTYFTYYLEPNDWLE